MSLKQKLTIIFSLVGIIALSLIARSLYLDITGHIQIPSEAPLTYEPRKEIPRERNGIVNKVSATEEQTAVQSVFELNIPKINLKKEVKMNIDPRYPNIYLPVLDQYIAHGKYTLLPNQAKDNGNVYLFAHRSSYGNKNNGFFRDLDEITAGDKAYITYDGKTYTYQYKSKKIIGKSETEVYTAYSPTPLLTLQTCHNGTLERLIVWWDLIAVD